MQLKTFEIGSKTEKQIEDWLDEVGDIKIDHTQIVQHAGYLRMYVFYEPKGRSRGSRKPVPELCRQCKKKPPIPGQKQCEDCKKYQDEYRQRRKKEEKVRYP